MRPQGLDAQALGIKSVNVLRLDLQSHGLSRLQMTVLGGQFGTQQIFTARHTQVKDDAVAQMFAQNHLRGRTQLS